MGAKLNINLEVVHIFPNETLSQLPLTECVDSVSIL